MTVFSSGRDPGSMDRIIFTDTSTTVSIIGRAITGAFPRGATSAEHRAEFHGTAMHDARGHEAPRNRK